MIPTKLNTLRLLRSSISAILNVVLLVSCNKVPLKADTNRSEVKVTNSMALGELDYIPIVRLGNNCTATLIAPNFLITTALCAQNNNRFMIHGGEKSPIEEKHILGKEIPMFFKPSEPLSRLNFGLLKIDSDFTATIVNRQVFSRAISLYDKALVPSGSKFDLVGFGCRDQDEPYIRGLKRKGRNSFVTPTRNVEGILTARGTGMTTLDPSAAYANSMGCLGDEGAPALVDNKIVGIYVGERPINGSKLKEAIYIDLTYKPTRDFIKAKIQSSPCNPYSY